MSLISRTLRLSSGQMCAVMKLHSNNTGKRVSRIPSIQTPKSICTTSVRPDLMEFFDDKKNWGENEVKHGRAWTKDELRIKSSSDLHALWYVLLKERNMLMTMEEECKRQNRLFASPERVDKVKISMENLESVVKERNKAYYELEVGEPAYVREDEEINTPLGVKAPYKTQEYWIPKEENETWKRDRRYFGSNSISRFLKFYREKFVLEKTRKRNRDRNEVIHLLKRFPDISIDLLREKFPDVDIDKIIKRDMARGHYVREQN